MDKQITTIYIAQITAPILSSRDIVDVIRKAVEKADTQSVKLDFTEVEFISRSAAHELLVMKEDYLRKAFKKELVFENTNESVTEMLRIVAANRAKPKTEEPIFNPREVSIDCL
jgi:anti-anti-sigma regulatory factor